MEKKDMPVDYNNPLSVHKLASELLNLSPYTDTREEDKEEARIKFPKKHRDED